MTAEKSGAGHDKNRGGNQGEHQSSFWLDESRLQKARLLGGEDARRVVSHRTRMEEKGGFLGT